MKVASLIMLWFVVCLALLVDTAHRACRLCTSNKRHRCVLLLVGLQHVVDLLVLLLGSYMFVYGYNGTCSRGFFFFSAVLVGWAFSWLHTTYSGARLFGGYAYGLCRVGTSGWAPGLLRT